VNIDRSFVLKETLLFSSVSNCHDIHVAEFWSGLAPVTVGQDLVPTDFCNLILNSAWRA
jgi:hypothetical protein